MDGRARVGARNIRRRGPKDAGLPLPPDHPSLKYPALSSAAIRATSVKTGDGGGLSAMNFSFRWSMIRHLRLLPLAVTAPAIPDLALGFQKGQPLQGQDRPEHVLAHPLGLRLRLGPDPAMDIEARVRPGENALGPLGAQKLLADQEPEDLPAEDLRQPRVVDPRDRMEDPRRPPPSRRLA